MRRLILGLAALMAAALWSSVATAQKIEVLWLGQSTTRITSTTGKVIVIDPFLIKNPKTPAKYKDLKALGKVDVILITHGHFDHTADAVALAKLTGAKIVANGALVRQLTRFGGFPKKQTISMNKSGAVMPIGAGIKIHMVPANHSAGMVIKRDGKGEYVYAGEPVGYVVELENGFKIYHSGDTGIFSDMALIHSIYAPDLALICIGGHFTMDPKIAAIAMRTLLKPKMVLPIHYATFPPLKGTPAQFKAAMKGSNIKVLVAQPGQALTF